MSAVKPNILFIDDEVRVLNTLKALFRTDYNVFTATEVAMAMDIVAHNPVHVVVSDQRMPEMHGVEVLRQIRERSPNTMRMLLTGYSDIDAIIGSVNEGEVFRYINKPWDNSAFLDTIRQAADIALRDASSVPAAGAAPRAATSTAAAVGIVVLDNDKESYAAVKAVCNGSQQVHHAGDIQRVMDLLENNDAGVVVSELSVGNKDVSGFLKLLKHNYPLVMTIVLTDVSDGHAIVELINEGQIFRFLPKHPKKGLLKLCIDSALERYRACKAQPGLLDRYQTQASREDSGMRPDVVARLRSLGGRLRAGAH
jgi:DNA-binding NtrC family response regulator